MAFKSAKDFLVALANRKKIKVDKADHPIKFFYMDSDGGFVDNNGEEFVPSLSCWDIFDLYFSNEIEKIDHALETGEYVAPDRFDNLQNGIMYARNKMVELECARRLSPVRGLEFLSRWVSDSAQLLSEIQKETIPATDPKEPSWDYYLRRKKEEEGRSLWVDELVSRQKAFESCRKASIESLLFGQSVLLVKFENGEIVTKIILNEEFSK